MESEIRSRQKGVECSEEGCTDWCTGNDLCPKHNMQKYRQTEEGKAYVKEYNKRYKRPGIDKNCESCGKPFVTARGSQVLCSKCSEVKGPYLAQKRCRAKDPRMHRARDIVAKRLKRGVSLFKGPCFVCGTEEDINAHHEDYNKPLDIVWLCRQHHRELHLKE